MALKLAPKDAADQKTDDIGDSLSRLLAEDISWRPYLEELSSGNSSLHLAIFRSPYLEYILSGKKSIESRFSKNGCAPYGQVSRGDVILLKIAGGSTQGICAVSDAWNYRLDKNSWREIKEDFLQEMFISDPNFLHDRREAVFATLMRLQHVRHIGPLYYHKRDRRGWVVLRHRREQTNLDSILES